MNNVKIKRKKPFLFRLSYSTNIFLFLLLLISFMLFFSGNYQFFSDQSLKMILRITSIISIILILFTVVNLFECIIFFFIKKSKRYWIYFSLNLLLLIISISIYLFIRILLILSNGI